MSDEQNIRPKYNDCEGVRCKNDPLLWHLNKAALNGCEHCRPCGARFVYGIPGVPDEVCLRDPHRDGQHMNENSRWSIVKIVKTDGRCNCIPCSHGDSYMCTGPEEKDDESLKACEQMSMEECSTYRLCDGCPASR